MPSPGSWFRRVLGFGPYFRPRSGALEGIFVASGVGVVSGIYIFKPLLDEMAINQAERKQREALEAGNGGSASNNDQQKRLSMTEALL
eukprot:CAMPEP_0117082100 /NCGR_PEP_ID=MMETSP0472-20121206/57831_1 /TAXON_ID=693140 ORGANISM="Tiarina fusus, Strain LIS" /NCGR_SAMPLE_ID=MMETSP0472 /ASSEMBLY_ACC=CAM_ASM_000603 /LENGTH=87 /DNA_ID=CAMNT_0004810233 /DNA_START=165 /DNA_END=428 /DNA_ORIENTATION=-